MDNFRIIKNPSLLFTDPNGDHIGTKSYNHNLYQSLCIPSTIHAYSCAIEYIREWFLSKFDPGFFKYIYVSSGNHYMDFKQFNKEEMLKREKPMLAINPSINFDFDNDTGSLYEMPIDILRRQKTFTNSFFQDKVNNIYLAMEPELYEYGFQFKIRVSSRSHQLDLWKYMNMAFRIGTLTTDCISVDFHLPSKILYAIAELSKFSVIKDIENKPKRLKDPYLFLQYMNKNSGLPITYKMRSINGKPEFFARINKAYISLRLDNKISVDDGDQRGMVSSNYHLELDVTLRMPAPKFYALYSTSEAYNALNFVEDATIGLYDIKIMDVPEINDRGWHQYLHTEYYEDGIPTEYPYDINIAELLSEEELMRVILDSVKKGISPSAFIEIKTFNDGKLIDSRIQYEDEKNIFLSIQSKLTVENIYIVIYLDMNYINSETTIIDNLNDTRIKI